MYHPGHTRITRIFLADRRPDLPGFCHIGGHGAHIYPDFDSDIRKMPKNDIFALALSRVYLAS